MADVKLNEATARTRSQLANADAFVILPDGSSNDSGARNNTPEKLAWSELVAEISARSGLSQTAVDARINALIAVNDVVKAASFDTSTHILTLTQNDNTDITVDLSSLATTSSGGATSFSGLSGSIAITQIPNNLITEAKLENGVRTKLNNRGEDNVQADWNQTNTGDDAFIRNKPTIPTSLSQLSGSVGEDNVQSDWNETDTNDDSFIQNKPTIPAAETASGVKAKLETLTGNDRLDASAVKNLPSGGGGGEANVQADWNETDTSDDSFIQNKPTIPTSFSQLSGQVADSQIPAGVTRDTELAGSITQLKGQGLPANRDTMKELSDAIDAIRPGEDNVQSDWNETNTSNDAFIQNKPTIPAAETASGVKAKLETLTGNDRLDASAVKNLPSGGGSSAFDLYPETGTQTTALAAGDRFVIADVSETGQPNRYVTATNARAYFKGYRGLWGDLRQNADRLYVGDTVQHAGEWYVVKVEHLRGGSGPDGDSTNFAPLDNYRGNFISGSYQPGIIVRHNSKTWLSTASVNSSDPVPGADANVKWVELGANNTVSDTALTEWFNQAVTISTANRLTALPSPNPTIPEHGLLVISWTDRGSSVNESTPIVVPCERLRGLTARAANDNVASVSSANVIRISTHIGATGGRIYASLGRTSANKLLIAVDNASDDPAPFRVWHMPTGGADNIEVVTATKTYTGSEVRALANKQIWVLTTGDITLTFPNASAGGDVYFHLYHMPRRNAGTLTVAFPSSLTYKIQVEEGMAIKWDSSSSLYLAVRDGGKEETVIYTCTQTSNERISIQDNWDAWRNKTVYLARSGSNDPRIDIAGDWSGSTGSSFDPDTLSEHDGITFIPGWDGASVRVSNLGPYALYNADGRTLVGGTPAAQARQQQVTEPDGHAFRIEWQDETISGVTYGWRIVQLGGIKAASSGASAFSQLTGNIAINQIPDDLITPAKLTDAAEARLLPAFPAVGSRDGKSPKFSGDSLSWIAEAAGGSSTATEWFDANVTVATAETLVALPSPNPTIPESGLLVVWIGNSSLATRNPRYVFSNSIIIPAEHLRGLTAMTAGTVVDSASENRNTVRVYVDVSGSLQAVFARTAANKMLFATDRGFDPKPLRIWHVPAGGGGGEDFDLWEISRSATELHDIDRVVFGDSRSTGNPNTWINAANARKFFKAYRGEWGSLTQNTSRLYVGDAVLHNGGYFFCKNEHLRGGSGPDGDTTNFVAIETYWGDFNAAYDYHVGRIVKHDNKFWINDAAITSTDPAPGATGNTKWHRIDGGGSSSPAEPVIKEISANTTYYLKDEYAAWKNKTILIYSNGSSPSVTIEPDSGAGLWEPGSDLTEQRFNFPASSFYPGSDNITLEPTPAQRARFTDTKFGTGNRYPARIRMWDDGRADILIADDATTSTGSLGRSDLSDAFEVSGHITVVIDSDRISFAMGASDRTEPYALSGLHQDFRDFVNKFKVAGNQTKTSTVYFSILDTTDVSDELGSKLTIQPMWQDGEVQLKYFDFARHQSDGTVRTFSKSGTATNATEGEGMPFEMIFANNLYFAGTTGKKWFITPLTQNVDGVVAGWAKRGNVLTKVPASLLPHGHGGQVVGTFVAQSSNFRMVKASHPINARITTTAHPSTTVAPFLWDIQTNELAAVYNGRDAKLELPYKRRVQNQNGYFLQAVRAADDAVTSEIFIPFDMSSGSDLRFIDSDGNLADLELFANTTNNQSAGSAFRLTRWTIEPNEQFWIEWNPGTGPNWTAKFADDEFFYIKVYEWIDSASPIAQSSGGSAQGQGAFDLRREEEVALSLSGTSVDVGGSTGFRVDENATHFEITAEAPSNLSPNGIIWHYQLPGETVWHDLYDTDGDSILLYSGETVSYRFNKTFFHVSGGRNYVKTRFTASTAMSGTLNLTLKHEEDVNSATVKPLKLLTSQVVVASQTLGNNLSGNTMEEVDFDVPIEYDNLLSITILLTTDENHVNEKSRKRLMITKDEIEEVGLWSSTDTLPNSTNIKAWFAEGWASQGLASSLNSWNTNPTASNVYHYANSSGTPTRIIGLQKTGAYLTGLYVCPLKQPCTIKNISCMRKI